MKHSLLAAGIGSASQRRRAVALALVGLWATVLADAADPASAANKGQGALRLLSEPVRTSEGLVSGVPGRLEGVAAFKGIPFGAPPLGALRTECL